jgi:hypothetical protein
MKRRITDAWHQKLSEIAPQSGDERAVRELVYSVMMYRVPAVFNIN